MDVTRLRREIAQAQPPIGMSVKVVAIDGHGGSGKTTLAKSLAKQINAEIVHGDDFASYDNPLNWWPRLVNEVLDPIKNGSKTLSYRRGSWYKKHKPLPVENQPVTPVMIIEGVSSSRKEFRPYLTFSIWVETPLAFCLQRGIERDMSDNAAGKSHEQIVGDWNKWHEYEKEYVQRDNPREYVNLIVDSAG